MTFAGADRARGGAMWERRRRAPTPTLVGLSSARYGDTALVDNDEGFDRRHVPGGEEIRVVACVEVTATGVALEESAEALRRLAVMRMERCIRPADRVCLLGASRLAVCFGHGSHRIAPRELGTRLARAMGRHLTVGATTLDLRVSVGVGAGTTESEPSLLTGVALSSTRASSNGTNGSLDAGSASVTVVNVPEPHRLLQLAPADGPRSTRSPRTPAAAAATTHRLLRRTLFRRDDEHGAGRLGPSPSAPRVVESSELAGFTLLIVDPVACETPRSAVQGVAAGARRLGVFPILSAADRPDTVIDDFQASEPDAVVLILHPDTAPRFGDAESGTPWEHPARLTRALVEAGASVIALSVGASAAGVAACVEQGAAGLLHVDALAEELVMVGKVAAAKPNGSARPESNGTAGAGRGRRQLPTPFDALVHLTFTERKVLFHMMEGRAAGDIAAELVVSLTTVRSHIRSILRKLNV
ncbi:MAG TPA: LuxR C-terminal-related transcriptional regulator, partial [Acidimicrobiales bacterium]|nr:LuxR C-terminal-related transcriptional regulator [Acidimicrobiales bacterium]